MPAHPTAEIQAATRSADELGAQRNPQAQLHLKLADEQLEQAEAAAANNDRARTEGLLHRAQADAELALALTRSGNAKAALNDAAAPATSH